MKRMLPLGTCCGYVDSAAYSVVKAAKFESAGTIRSLGAWFRGGVQDLLHAAHQAVLKSYLDTAWMDCGRRQNIPYDSTRQPAGALIRFEHHQNR
jgi:hypothetical protein